MLQRVLRNRASLTDRNINRGRFGGNYVVIYFVDEDIGGTSAYPIALEMKGHEVTTIPDATQALSQLPGAADVQVVVIDVMLATGMDPLKQFTDDLTRSGLETGLVLLSLLAERAPTIFPMRAVLLSAATDDDLLNAIDASGQEHEIPFWSKDDFTSTSEFCSRLTSHIDRLTRN